MTRTVNARGRALGLTWNLQRQLVSVSTNGVFAESYAYDPLGRRVSTTDMSGTVYHAYDGIHCVADLDGDGSILRAYTWGAGVDNLLAVTLIDGMATNTLYAVTDPLGTVHALVDSGGTVTVSYTYDSWGNLLSASGSDSLIASLRFTWQGREYSHVAGLYNFRARWYDPAAGRWLSKDPIGLEGGLNLYEAFGNNPINQNDPLGLWGVQFGDTLIGSGNPWMEFDRDSWGDMGRGLAAGIDGMIPKYNPFVNIYANECGEIDNVFQISRKFGEISGHAFFEIAGLRIIRIVNKIAMPKVLYHFTSAQGEAGILAKGMILPSKSGIEGSGVYLTAFNNKMIAIISGAKGAEKVITVSTEGLNVSPTCIPGTYIVKGVLRLK